MQSKAILTLAVILTVLGTGMPSLAQYKIDTTVPVRIQGNQLKNPWVGGLNAPIFSEVDMNGDGIKDLFVFDREGFRVSTYINNGTPGQVDYTFAPEYEYRFPNENYDWILLKDYDCDGKEDMFAYNASNAGMTIFRNDYTTQGGLKFTQTYSVLNSKYGTVTANLYVARVNLPALVDIDYDGDLDVLTFPVTGNYIEFHKNRAKENFNRCDTLVMEVEFSCFGNFGLSGLSNSAILNAGCRIAAEPPHVSGDELVQHSLHSGSCMIALDIDGDNDYDILNGDILGDNMLLVVNGGSSSGAVMSSQDSLFPQYDVSVDMFTFPAPYYFDADNDGNKDFIVTPCISGPAENYNNVWMYKNTTNNTTNVFNYTKNRFLSDEMIEVGAGANTVLYDIDTDGRTDMIIGNYGYYSDILPFKSAVSYYRNTGTNTAPEFDLISDDFGGFMSLGLIGLKPTFGDIDADGDADIMLGNTDGNIIYYTNTAGAGNQPAYTLTQVQLVNQLGAVIDVGQFSTPQLVDVNRDGKLDLLIGERSGNVNYYENTGTANVPQFTLVTTSFGGLNVTNGLNLYGYSYPNMYDSAGVYQLLVGSVTGYIYQYNNIDNNLGGNFNLVDSMYYSIHEPVNISVASADLTGDGYRELLVGNNAGGVTLYKYDTTTSVIDLPSQPANFMLYPNPASDQLVVKFDVVSPVERAVSLYDVTGRLMATQNINSGIALFDVSQFASGVYHCRVVEGNQVSDKIFIVR
jgi:hypothetical protein